MSRKWLGVEGSAMQRVCAGEGRVEGLTGSKFKAAVDISALRPCWQQLLVCVPYSLATAASTWHRHIPPPAPAAAVLAAGRRRQPVELDVLSNQRQHHVFVSDDDLIRKQNMVLCMRTPQSAVTSFPLAQVSCSRRQCHTHMQQTKAQTAPVLPTLQACVMRLAAKARI